MFFMLGRGQIPLTLDFVQFLLVEDNRMFHNVKPWAEVLVSVKPSHSLQTMTDNEVLIPILS